MRTTLSASMEATPTQRNGVALLPVRAGAARATLEDVNRIRDELCIA